MDEQKPKARIDKVSDWFGAILGWLILGLVVLGLLWINLTLLRGCVNLIWGR